MPITAEEAQAVLTQADCLYNAQQVDDALDRMAQKLNDRLRSSDPLVICVLRGGLIPTGLLMPRLQFPLQMDYLHATRYDEGTQGGEIQWIVTPSSSLLERTVLLVDDILDEGHTLAAIINGCKASGAKEVLSAVLVNKIHDRKNNLIADFCELDVEDRYVFGYGMDYKGYLRNANGIYAVNDNA